ncbi:MAG: alpha-amylase family glycosyl hydrolase [Desulfuromonadales bacterium]
MSGQSSASTYFRHVIPISAQQWRSLGLEALSRTMRERGLPVIVFYRQLAFSLNKVHAPGTLTVHAAHLNLFAFLQTVLRYVIDILAEEEAPGSLMKALRRSGHDPDGEETVQAMLRFVELFPPEAVLSGNVTAYEWLDMANEGDKHRRMVLREMLLLHHAATNPAVESFRDILADEVLAKTSCYLAIASGLRAALTDGPFLPMLGCTLGEVLWAPVNEAPHSLAAQIRFLYDKLKSFLPPELFEELATAFDFLLEEERERGWGGEPGPPPVLEFRSGVRHGGGMGHNNGDSIFAGFDYPEYEHFSQDADWMSNVVLMAKMVYVWLDQLSSSHDYPIARLDQIPDAELDRLATWGFTGLWLIGLWERSPASQRIKQICGNPDAIASAYSLYDYEVAADLGGWEALANLRERAGKRGIRLASDMVPNHTGIYSRWVIQHPDWFVQTDYPPFPTYQFSGEDLSHDGSICIQVEDGYWSKHDAAVVFKYYDRRDDRTRYIYHGNDGTSIPWNDTAQLNYLIPELREAVIQTILHVARNFPIIRFDAAMTLAKKHFQRLWFPLRGLGGGIPSRAEHGMSKEEFDTVFPVEFWREVVDRVAAEAPGTLLLAEAFWMMEGYFVRTLGMHRVYNSAFMNMLKTEENAKYRMTIKNVLEFNPEVLKRFVNFMNNPDEKTAVAQFGSQDKYFGACVLLATMPGLPMFGHGQIEGFHEKYGMEYKRAYWDEQIDEGLVRGHELWIFPLLLRRWLFSGSEHFVLYDFHAGDAVDENVFAYSNRAGEHRALVLYNNSYSTTSGRILVSAGFNVNTGDAEPEICRTTLGAVLGCSAEESVYFAFHDQIQGLEYLRSGRDIHDNGLYIELREYQFHVFIDFREIRDDAAGRWGQLCTALGGNGVESLEDELKQLRYKTLNKAFEAVLAPIVDLAPPIMDFTEVVTAVRPFMTEINTRTGLDKDIQALDVRISTVETSLTRITALLRMKPVSKDAGAFRARVNHLLSSADNCRIMLAWILLRDLKPGILELFGLDCCLRRMLAEDALHKTGLLSALLGVSGESLTASSAFSSSVSREFLHVHENGGMEWFNKECFEEMAEWLSILGFLVSDKHSPAAGKVSALAAQAEKELNHSIGLAANVGYRSGLFLHLATVPERSATAERVSAGGRKNTKVKPDVKKSARARAPKTLPDNVPD